MRLTQDIKNNKQVITCKLAQCFKNACGFLSPDKGRGI